MSAVALGVGRGSKMVSNDADWLLRDEFISDLAAGSINGTAAEPGPGTRTVNDTGNAASITGGSAVFSAVAGGGNPRIVYDNVPITRVAGRMLLVAGSNNGRRSGFFSSSTTPLGTSYSGAEAGVGDVSGAARFLANNTFTPVSVGTALPVATCLRAAGAFFLFYSSSKWQLSWIVATGSTATLYVAYAARTIGLGAVSWLRVPVALWLPTPLASDSFGSAFGTTDGLGHAEGIAGGIGAGGSGKTWSNAGGTWSVSSAKAINTAPSGLSQQMSVAEMSKADVFTSAALTRAAGSVGLAVSMDSASSPANGVLVYLDGTNCKVDKIVAGITSNVQTTAVTYSAGARLTVSKFDTEYRVDYNNALVGAVNTISDASIVSNTLHGLFSTDASNTLDDYTCYATGTGGEYAELDKWS